MEDTLGKLHRISNEMVPYIGSMRVGIATHGDEVSVIKINGDTFLCHGRKELDKCLDSILLVLQIIKMSSEQAVKASDHTESK